MLDASRLTGRRVSIVSNNSREAVACLDAHKLTVFLDRMVGRYDDMDRALLKPSHHLVDFATVGTGTPPHASSLVGGAVSDIEAAVTAPPAGRSGSGIVEARGPLWTAQETVT